MPNECSTTSNVILTSASDALCRRKLRLHQLGLDLLGSNSATIAAARFASLIDWFFYLSIYPLTFRANSIR